MVRNGIYDEIMMGSEIINAELIAVFDEWLKVPHMPEKVR